MDDPLRPGGRPLSRDRRLKGPDLLEGIALNLLGPQLEFLETLPSTMDRAWERAAEGAEPGLIVVAAEQRRSDGPEQWRRFWSEVETASKAKHKKLSLDAVAGLDRERTRKVELTLGESQLAFRADRIASLHAEYLADASFGGWVNATSETTVNWLKQEAWRLILSLLAIWIGIQLALRLI